MNKLHHFQKTIVLCTILLFNLTTTKLNAQTITRYLTDFGAVGDSTTDNTDAFIKAGLFFSNFLTNDTTGILIIPSYHPTNTTNPALYKVGRQLTFGQHFNDTVIYNGDTAIRIFHHWQPIQAAVIGMGDTFSNYGMLQLSNVHGMVIKGSDPLHPPTIKYKDSLMFGSFLKPDSTFTSGAFTQTNTTLFPQPLLFYGYNQTQQTKGWIGHFIEVKNSSNVLIKDLRIDGNNTAFIWGGTYSPDGGIQLPHAGICCKYADTITVKNVHANRFGFDGILLDDGTKHVILDSCKFNENVRGGISWVGGEHLTVTNCEANENGKTVPVSSLANPGTGIDIEPDLPDSCKYGYFYKCTFNNNLGPAISTNQIVAHNVYDMHFDSCTIYAKRQIGIFCTGRKYKFENCNIYAAVSWSSVGNIEAEAIKYLGCHFEDKPYNGTEYWEHNEPLISIPGFGNVGNHMKWTCFENCTFKVNDSLREFFYLNWNTGGMTEQDWTVIDNCTFTYHNKGKANIFSNFSALTGVCFKNHNLIQNTLNSTNSYHLFVTRDIKLAGTDNACNPAVLEFSGQVEHLMYSTSGNAIATDTFSIGKKENGNDGYAVYRTDKKALSFVEKGTHIGLNHLSAWRNLSEGSQIINGKIDFGGQATFDAHSHFFTLENYNHFFSDNGNQTDLLYIDSLANYNSTTTSPVWTTGEGYATGGAFIKPFESNWLDTVTPNITPCFQGNHPSLNNALSCAPNYTHMQAQGAITLLYNLQVPCTGNNADIQFTTIGGKRPFPVAYKLDGVITDSNLTSITAGQHTITVTDSSCSVDFVVRMDTVLTHKIVKGCVSASGNGIFTTNSCTQPLITGPATAILSNDTVKVTVAGTYIITDTVSAKTDSVYIGSCTDCSNAPDTAEWKAPNLSSSELFPDGFLPLSSIVLQGAIDIDSLLIFNNQRDIYCTANTQLILTDSNTFICTRTKIRGCTDYWKGIKADGFGKSVIINNASTLQDMSEGVHIMNNAFLQARNSTYHNNTAGIFFENIKEPAYKSAITGNIFKSDTAIIGANCAGITGILAFNSTDIEIGDSLIASSGNYFHDLYSGIAVMGDTNMPIILNDNTSRIGIYNSRFKDIANCSITGSYPVSQKINGCYGNFFGAGVYANFGMVPSTFDARIDVRNTNDTNTVIRFENCDKAIVIKNASVKAKNLYMYNNLMGIMCNGTTSKKLEIQNNHINRAVIGMQFIGNNTNSYVRSNTIDSLYGTSTGLYTHYWGTGIDVRHFTNADTSNFEVKDNSINVNGFAGRGINMENTGLNVQVMKNEIGLTWDQGEVVCIDASLLNGISATNIQKSLIYKNTITGSDSINALQREDITGILINNSSKPRVECNIADRTRFGISAISECLTDTDGVKGNTANEQVLGWVFRHLGSEGTFGNVGTLNFDNHNLWTGNAQQYKVYKFCEDVQGYAIYTHQNFLTLLQSNSYNIADQTNNTCPYDVTQNQVPYVTYTCPVNFNFQQPFNGTSSGTFPHTEAISIATHTKTYSEYPEIAYWMDARKLYRDLDNSASYRNSNDTLLAFYDSLHTAIIEHIEATETNITNLIQSMNSQNYELYLQRLEEAKGSNSNVVSNEDQENNEHDINAIYIKIISYGIDALNDDDSTRIVELANLCPYIGGTAVYKARALYVMYSPANMFDDIAMCNAIGVYKQGGNNIEKKGIFDDENAHLESLKPKENILAKYSANKFFLYPNPASTTVTIAYQLNTNEKGNLIIYDILGREQMKIDLNNSHNKVSINVSSLRQGIYTYKYLVNDKKVIVGKLLID